MHRQAGQDAKRHVAAPFVLIEPPSDEVLAYYTLSSSSVDLTDFIYDAKCNEQFCDLLRRVFPDQAARQFAAVAAPEFMVSQTHPLRRMLHVFPGSDAGERRISGSHRIHNFFMLGMGVAQSLLRAGFEVHVCDVKPEAVQKLTAAGAHAATDALPAAGGLCAVIAGSCSTATQKQVLSCGKARRPSMSILCGSRSATTLPPLHSTGRRRA